MDDDAYREARKRHYLIEQKVNGFRVIIDELLDYLYEPGRFNMLTRAMTEEEIYGLRDNMESVTRAVGLKLMSHLQGKEFNDVMDIEGTLKRIEVGMVKMSKGLNSLKDEKASELESRLRGSFMDCFQGLLSELKEMG